MDAAELSGIWGSALRRALAVMPAGSHRRTPVAPIRVTSGSALPSRAPAARSTEFRFEMYRVLLTPVGALGAFEGRLRADYKSQPSATRLLCAWRCGGGLCHAAGRCTRRADGEAAQMERHDALGQRFLFHDYARRDAETAHRFPDEAALCNCLSGAPAAARRVFTLQNLKHKDGSRGKLHLNG